MEFNIEEIQEFLPHRYPLLLIDRVLEMEEGKSIKAIKNVTINEEFFQGHFPGHPIMPGVLIVEAMAQVSGFLMKNTVDDPENKIPYFAGIDRARFRKTVRPGDQLRIVGEVIRLRKSIAKLDAKAYVEEELVAEAELLFAMQEK